MDAKRRLLFDCIASRGAADALVAIKQGIRLSGSTLLQRIDAAAAALAALGLVPGDRLMALLPNGIALAVLYLACLRGRYVVVPANPETPQDDLTYMIELARPKVVFVHGVESSVLSRAQTVAWDGPRVLDLPAAPPPAPPRSKHDIFSITFTSGTTNRPKAVVHTAEGMLGNADAFNRFLACGPDMRMLHVMPMYYMAGLLNTLLCPLMAGGMTVCDALFSPRSALVFWRHVIEHEINAFWLSPTMLQVTMQLDRTDGSAAYARERLRYAFVGTAPLSPQVAADFAARYSIDVLQSYGLSELLLVSVDKPGSARPGSVGFLLDEVKPSLAEDGELKISTPFAFAGYLDSASGALPDTSTQAAMQRNFPTGDLARIEPDGRLTISGRKKDLIIVGGVNVSPVAIEHFLIAHTDVEHAAVVAAPDSLYGEVPVAFIVPKQGAPRNGLIATLEADAAAYLPQPARPVRYVVRDELPMGPTGKVQKHFLMEELNG